MVLLIANSRGGDSVLPISDCDVGKVSVHEWIELCGAFRKCGCDNSCGL